MRKQPRQKWRFQVFVRKEYFPKASWSTKMTSYQKLFVVSALTRTEAALIVWREFGAELLAEMIPNIKIVTFEVNDPASRQLASRLNPVKVFDRTGLRS